MSEPTNNPDESGTQWKPGDIANGHRLGPDGVWRPVPREQPQKRAWFKRPVGIIGIDIAVFLLLSAIGGIIGGEDSENSAVTTATDASSEPASAPAESASASAPKSASA